MNRSMSKRRMAANTFAVLMLLGCSDCPGVDEAAPATIVCDQPSLEIEIGGCVELPNLCGSAWEAGDAFELCSEDHPAPEGLMVMTRSTQQRLLCALPGSVPVSNARVDFHYHRDGRRGVGSLSVTIDSVVRVRVYAAPETIAPGENTLLTAFPSGGIPPYRYEWTPAEGLDDPLWAFTNAFPTTTTTYTVRVTGADGRSGEASVLVTVTAPDDLVASASATPLTIVQGENAQLTASVQGGTPPYSYAWSPADSLDDPTAAAPTATPASTTTYTVVVRDAAGTERTATTTVAVTASAGLTACFTAEQTGYEPGAGLATVQVDGSCSTGEIAVYRWWPALSFDGQLPSYVTSDPIPPAFLYEGLGTFNIRLEVEDGPGNTHSLVIPFTVTGSSAR